MGDEKNVSSKPKGKLPKWVWLVIIGSTLFYCVGCTALLGTDTKNESSKQEVKEKEDDKNKLGEENRKEEAKKEIAPKITIFEPEDNKEVESDKITFGGNVKPNKTTVTIKDKQVEVLDNGDFETEVNLEEGENNIEIKATHEDKDTKVNKKITRISEEQIAEKKKAEEEKQKLTEERSNFDNTKGNNHEAASTAQGFIDIFKMDRSIVGIDMYLSLDAPEEAENKFKEGGNLNEYRKEVNIANLMVVINNAFWNLATEGVKNDLVYSWVNGLHILYSDGISNVTVNNGIRDVAEGKWSVWSGEPKVELK